MQLTMTCCYVAEMLMFLFRRTDGTKEIELSRRSSESLCTNRASLIIDTDRFGDVTGRSIRNFVPDATSSQSTSALVFKHALQEVYKVKAHSDHYNKSYTNNPER